MKRNNISGGAVILFGLLIALGPQFLFKMCGQHESGYSACHYAGLAELCVGILIASVGICIVLISDIKVQLGLTIGLFLMAIVAGLIPYEIFFGVCDSDTMSCRNAALPALTVLSSCLLIGVVYNMIYLEKKTKT
ncbi:MAG: DUF4418 family protein [Treponema sp.]|nr:DUF4418 family protein [Treponema sp.]